MMRIGKVLLVGAAMLGCGFPATMAWGHEDTEWIRSYSFNALDNKTPRVLLLGDSICFGYQEKVREKLKGKMSVTYWATSKCASEASWLKELEYILGEHRYTVIHLNNGLHSFYANRQAYAAGLTAAIKLIRAKQPDAVIIWADSTPLTDAKLTAYAVELNAIALKVMKKNNVTIENNLFAKMEKLNRGTYWVDPFHFNSDGNEILATQVANMVLKAIEK